MHTKSPIHDTIESPMKAKATKLSSPSFFTISVPAFIKTIEHPLKVPDERTISANGNLIHRCTLAVFDETSFKASLLIFPINLMTLKF